MEPDLDKREEPVVRKKTLAVWIATGLGVGLVTPAPGTFGTLWGLPLTFCIAFLPNPALQIACIAALFAIGIPICTQATRDLGGAKDPGSIVLDEIVSLPVVFLLLPMEQLATKPLGSVWLIYILGFLLHRLFDILKPPPIRYFEKLPNGLGIMSDDILAGAFGCGVLNLLLWRFPSWF